MWVFRNIAILTTFLKFGLEFRIVCISKENDLVSWSNQTINQLYSSSIAVMQTNYDTDIHWSWLFQTVKCQCPRLFIFLVLSLWIAKQRLRQTASTLCKNGWSGLIRMVIGRLREVGSRISWVRWVLLGCTKMSLNGKYMDITLSVCSTQASCL